MPDPRPDPGPQDLTSVVQLTAQRRVVYTRADGTPYVDYVLTGALYRRVKPALDRLLAGAFLVLLAPVMAVVAAVIKSSSPGPILFQQERVGRDGRSFRIFKFRTMRNDSEATTGPVWAKSDDPRRTWFGAPLRSSRLDELPLLWNVLRGQMSLVGPRAERPAFVEFLRRDSPVVDAVLTLTPGIANFSRAALLFPRGFSTSVVETQWRWAAEAYYLQRQSAMLDAQILLASLLQLTGADVRLGLPTRQVIFAHIVADELEREGLQERFEVGARFDDGMPSLSELADVLRAFDEARRFVVAAHAAFTRYHKRRQLDAAAEHIKAVFTLLDQNKAPGWQALWSAATTWQSVIAAIQNRVDAEAPRELPNPFRAGEPLTPEFGREVFRGREDLVRMIEGLLTDPSRSSSLALIGPRRCGKTSLLRMLPAMLPGVHCVFFDLQDNPVSSPARFFGSLVRRTQEQLRDRTAALPDASASSEDHWLKQAADWFERVNTENRERPLLICIDEFERLDALWPGDELEMRQFLSLVRSTIQHRHHVRFLVSGEAPFEELPAIWTDTFINIRQLRVGHLGREAATALLRRPISDFPNCISDEIAGSIYERVGGQPYLLQLYGSLLIDHLNHDGRQVAQPSDLVTVEDQVLMQAGIYFRQLVRSAPTDAQRALLALANEGSPSLTAHARRWLIRRNILSAEGAIAIPVLARWMREEWEDARDFAKPLERTADRPTKG